ncbi:pantoate--beta-alanine ligase [Microbacterium sp. SYP-A9085]|uniref:pantoate--beta-alanine ligase n=1 Tax=Microbacterium sp. SYP-A9085 TaxID=2664454 RepID=UPI00129BC53A|nr:pantoate--beta-alanine ligase [Microbacterium sp. SYP-A9085]MRH30072.1 pantoate--beta-alanine ligase [Microbacterium sp. SYP-A9085]
MRVLRTAAEVRAAVAGARARNARVGLVPTMGAFHDGHISLMRAARDAHDLVVVSLFVNPTQFGPAEDLAAYPRDEQRDARIAEQAGVDILFAPSVAEMYPHGFSTTIHVSGLTDVMDGAARPGHFDGVATVVAKLFAIVGPDAAYFGQKDAQQVLVVRRVARDLNLPVRVVGCPIVREPDGLAMSSRNVYLDAADRARATALHRALVAAEDVVARSSTSADVILDAARAELRAAGIQPEYLDLRSPDDLTEVDEVAPTALLAVAARVGAARLIDNTILETR